MQEQPGHDHRSDLFFVFFNLTSSPGRTGRDVILGQERVRVQSLDRCRDKIACLPPCPKSWTQMGATRTQNVKYVRDLGESCGQF